MAQFVAINFLSFLKALTKPRRKKSSSKSVGRTRFKRNTEVIPIVGDGGYDIEVVGEQSYLRNFERVFGKRDEDGVDIHCKAYLVPEPSNQYDSNAVQVFIEEVLVGYLSKVHAKKLIDSLSRVGRLHMMVEVEARVRGGWYRSPEDNGQFGVTLDFPSLLNKKN